MGFNSAVGKLLQQAGLIEGANSTVGRTNLSNREEWLQHTLANIASGKRILDAGAGELKYKKFCSHLEYISQDFGQYDGSGDGSGLQTKSWDNSHLDIVSDITNIPEPDASFDAIMCIEVLEHVPSPVNALQELVRLLRPGGILIITAPFCSITHFSPYFYQTGYSRYFYEYWLAELDCEIQEIQYNGSYFHYLAQELHRLPSISERYANVQMNRWQRLCMKGILKFLDNVAAADTGSNELLAYGIHVLASKKNGEAN